MGGFNSVFSALPVLSNVVGAISGQSDNSKEQAAAMRALQARQAAEYNYAASKSASERAEIAQKAATDEAARQAALKRAVARQRAQFGASGITPGTSGSAQAVLLGLFEESDDERVRREELDRLRYQALDDELGYRQRLNVLALEDARARQKIGSLTSWADTIGKIV